MELTRVCQEKQEASGAISEDKNSQALTASATAAAPSAGQVAGDEAENQPADVVNNKRPTCDAVEATQAADKVAPDASGIKSTSVSNEVNTALREETTPAKAVPEPELGEDPAPRPPPTDASAPPPVPKKDTARAPEKDTAVTNKPTPTSEETSVPPSQTAEPAPTKVEDANKTEEPSAQPTEPEADSSKLDAVDEAPKPQSGVDGDNRAGDEGSATQDGDGKADGATRLTLRMDRVRELSTASIRPASSSTPGTPTEEVASSAVDEEEPGAPEQVCTLSRKRTRKEKEKEKKEREREKKKKKKKKNKGEKNSPHPPSGETVHNADNSSIQDRNPPVVANPPSVDIPSGEGEGELVEKAASDEEDAPVMVDKVDSSGEYSAVKVEMP
jgi:hypothetical protein